MLNGTFPPLPFVPFTNRHCHGLCLTWAREQAGRGGNPSATVAAVSDQTWLPCSLPAARPRQEWPDSRRVRGVSRGASGAPPVPGSFGDSGSNMWRREGMGEEMGILNSFRNLKKSPQLLLLRHGLSAPGRGEAGNGGCSLPMTLVTASQPPHPLSI